MRRGVFSLFLTLLSLLSSLAVPPKEVYLGGLFSQTRYDGLKVSIEEQQHLAGFLLAVREINNDKISILPDTEIKIAVKDTRSHVGETFFAALSLSRKSFNGRGVDACIGATTSGESDAAATVFSHYSTVQVSFSATSPLLSSRISSPFFGRTCPSDIYQGAAMANMAAHYGWMKVSTFANSDSYGSSGIRQFEASAAESKIQILSASLFPVGHPDFSKPIAEALTSGAKIFVFFMTMKDMRELLIQGDAAGLFHDGTQIIASDAAIIGSYWEGMDNKEVARLMKGMIAFTPAADYRTSEGSKFLNSFIKQQNTNENPVTKSCNTAKDDDNNYLFQHNSTTTNVPICSGIDFSKFATNDSNVDNYASYTYDATYAIARAMHVLLYDQKKPKINGSELYTALIRDVSFEGATGLVDFANASTSDRYGEGDRGKSGVRYEILNFDPKEFKRTKDSSGSLKNNSGFIKIGGWTIEGKINLTHPIVFNTLDNSVPSYLPPPIQLYMSRSHVTLLKCFGGLLIVSTVLFGSTLKCYRGTKLVRSIQFKMQCIILTGALLGAARILIGINPVTDLNCSKITWLAHLSFWMILGPMMLKTWRVYRIINCSTTSKPNTLSENYILRIFGCIFICVAAYLTALQVLGISSSITHTIQTVDGIQIYLDDRCSRRGEAIVIGTCVAIICFPLITSLPRTTGSTKEFIRSTGIFLTIFCTICILHGERTMLLLLNYDIGRDHQISKKKTFSAQISREEFKKQSSQFRTMAESKYGGSTENPFIAVKTENLLDRREVCRIQLIHWSKVLRHTEAMMLVQAEDESSIMSGCRLTSLEAVPVATVTVERPIVASIPLDIDNRNCAEFDADNDYFDEDNSDNGYHSESDYNELYYSHPNPHIVIIPKET